MPPDEAWAWTPGCAAMLPWFVKGPGLSGSCSTPPVEWTLQSVARLNAGGAAARRARPRGLAAPTRPTAGCEHGLRFQGGLNPMNETARSPLGLGRVKTAVFTQPGSFASFWRSLPHVRYAPDCVAKLFFASEHASLRQPLTVHTIVLGSPLRVIRVVSAVSAACPLCPQERPKSGHRSMSAKGRFC